MKYAIISDIHGNNIALKEALKIIEKENVSKIICLGDIVGIGVRSDECVKILKSYGEEIMKTGFYMVYQNTYMMVSTK